MESLEEEMKRLREPIAAWARRWNIPPAPLEKSDATTYSGSEGFVGPGWIPMLDRLAEDLIALGWDRTLHQVVPKFGQLLFDIGSRTPPRRGVLAKLRRRIEWARAESLRTCERCGAPGRSTQPGGEGGVVETLCPRCFELEDAAVRARNAEEEQEQAELDAASRAEEDELARNDPEYRKYLETHGYLADARGEIPTPDFFIGPGGQFLPLERDRAKLTLVPPPIPPSSDQPSDE